jgi:N-acetylglucosamine malate deacetylase 1
MGTRGTPEQRLQESHKAAEILKVDYRVNLEMKDGSIEHNEANYLKAITAIRRFRPKMLLINPHFERHPDHEDAHRLMRTAMFKSGLNKVVTQFNGINQERWRIRKMFAFMMSYPFTKNPDFYVDISDTFTDKMDSIKAYVSQINIPGISRDDEPVTRLSRPEFLNEIESRLIYFGTQIGCRYAEAFYSVEPIGISNIGKFI